MASSDIVTPSRRLIFIGDVEANRPNSEAINQKIAGGMNFLLERTFVDEDFTYQGFFQTNNFSLGMAGIRYVEKDSVVSLYTLGILSTGGSGVTTFNIQVYNSSGTFVNNLFGAGAGALAISGGNGNRVLIGRKDVDKPVPSNITINTAGHSISLGTLNFATIPEGSMLVPVIQGHANQAYNLHFKLRLKEI